MSYLRLSIGVDCIKAFLAELTLLSLNSVVQYFESRRGRGVASFVRQLSVKKSVEEGLESGGNLRIYGIRCVVLQKHPKPRRGRASGSL